MEQETNRLERARVSRDPRFDGRFFIGVKTTGIYCRPICPVRLPKAENVTFFPSAASAAEAGYRPCLRCRPETAPGTPAWSGTTATVSRALRLIEEGALDLGSVNELSERLGVSSRHLNRLFQSKLGASPKSVALTRRIHFAKQLLDQSSLSVTQIALSAGYGSLRRCNDHFLKTYGRSPSELRGRTEAVGGALVLKLPYRPPFDWQSLLSFFAMRATPGVELVNENTYERTFRLKNQPGLLTVTHDESAHQLRLEINAEDMSSTLIVVERVRRLFDLDSDFQEISRDLGVDLKMKHLLANVAGLRLPGAFDPFEAAVRAMVGQQVSVKGATTVIGRIVSCYGDAYPGRIDMKCFPDAKTLAELDPETLSMPIARARAIKSMSAAVARGDIQLHSAADPEQLREELMAIKGIGPWTAQYVVMRALSYPDAFLENDLVLLKAAKDLYGDDTHRQLITRSEAWRPWRAYACLALWRYAATLK